MGADKRVAKGHERTSAGWKFFLEFFAFKWCILVQK